MENMHNEVRVNVVKRDLNLSFKRDLNLSFISDSARPPARRRSKRRDMKKQGSVLHSYFPNAGTGKQR